MPDADLPHDPQPVCPADPTLAARHRNLVLISAILATATALVAAAYGLARDLVALRALALEMALPALAAWLCLNACRLRRRAVLVESFQYTTVSAPKSQTRIPVWEAALGEAEEAEETVSRWGIEHARKLHYLFLALIPAAIILVLAGQGLWTSEVNASAPATGADTALALVALAASCLWSILARSFNAVPKEKLP